MEFCLAYVPSRAELYRLNPAAWFVLRMCEKSSRVQIAAEYAATMGNAMSPVDCRREVHAGIDALLEMGIIEEAGTRRTRNRTRRQRRNRNGEEKRS
jgi:hypothetical protein